MSQVLGGKTALKLVPPQGVRRWLWGHKSTLFWDKPHKSQPSHLMPICFRPFIQHRAHLLNTYYMPRPYLQKCLLVSPGDTHHTHKRTQRGGPLAEVTQCDQKPRSCLSSQKAKIRVSNSINLLHS